MVPTTTKTMNQSRSRSSGVKTFQVIAVYDHDTDYKVRAGTTYYYVVQAVNSKGTQSAYSKQAKAVIPYP